MIHSFNLRNFCSFADAATVDFSVGRQAPETTSFVTSQAGQKLTKLIGVFGANGSGKTSLLKGLVFLRWFMLYSFRVLKKGEPIRVDSFAFRAQPDPVQEFGVVFEVDGSIYRYELKLKSNRLLAEALYRKGDRNFSYLFKCSWAEGATQADLQSKLPGLEASALRSMLRENCSFLSVLNQAEKNPLSAVTAYWENMETNVNRWGRDDSISAKEEGQILSVSEFYQKAPEMMQQVSALMSHPQLDFGLSGITIELQKFNLPDKPDTVELPVPYGKHHTNEGDFKLPLWSESSGTKSTFILLRYLLSVLANGGLAVMDEFEVDLHPLMIPPILELFINTETNPKNAQLLFSCHSAEIMQRLDKTQLLLVAKDENCRSQTWRLDSMKGVRRDDNLYAKYMAGAYGAVPNV
jgi:hypothetical protein